MIVLEPESKELLDMLNEGVAKELHLSIKFMWQRLMVRGVEGATVENILRQAAITEMKNAEKLAERLVFIDGVPVNKVEPIHIGTSLDEMLKEDVQAEEEAVAIYRHAIQQAAKEGDFATRLLLEDILTDAEKNLDKFSKLLVGMTKPFTQLKLDSE